MHASIDRVFLRLDDRPEILVSIRLARARASRAAASASAHRAPRARDSRRAPFTRRRRLPGDVPGDDDRRRVAVWERAPFERVSSVFALAAPRAMSRRDDGADALEIVGQIGEGSFGRVMYARNRTGARRASASTASASRRGLRE